MWITIQYFFKMKKVLCTNREQVCKWRGARCTTASIMFFYVCRTRKQRYGNLPVHAWAESGRAHRRNSPCGFFQGRELCSWMREETGRFIDPSTPLVLSNFEPPEYIYSKNNINYSKIKSFKISEISRTR